ncbi:MAG: hypothetical protein RLZZ338_3177 [Cyanobacteriota bacterium]|jgi:hypothetical protein
MRSQWESFLQNLGEWEGSFTQFSPKGEWVEDIPSVINIEGLNNNEAARLTLRRVVQNPKGGEPVVNELVRVYQSLGRDILFFENGAFSQGSIQLAPFTEIGAEFGLIYQQRRLRLVQLFNKERNLANITLIREKLKNTNYPERPPLTLESLLGEWQGDAITIYPDWRSPDTYATHLQLQLKNDGRVSQKLTWGTGINTQTITSSARVEGSILSFDESSQPMQVLLLPDGASSTSPLQIELRKPLFLEVGWLVEPEQRQRMIRRYNEKGEWVSLTLVTEYKVD